MTETNQLYKTSLEMNLVAIRLDNKAKLRLIGWWYEDKYGYLLLLKDDVGRSCQYK